MLPEQGRSPGIPVRSRADSRRHGAATSSARTWHPGYLILPSAAGTRPPQVATADRLALAPLPAVVTPRHLPG